MPTTLPHITLLHPRVRRRTPRLGPLLTACAALAAAAPAADAAAAPIDAGDDALCVIGDDGGVTCHGLDASIVAHVKDFTQVGVGLGHACGLRATGDVICWSDGGHPAELEPPGPFTTVGSGWSVSCALDPLGIASCWGEDAGYGQLVEPAEPLHGLAVGEFHECALRADDTAVCWGADVSGQATPEPGTFTALSAGGGHTCGLRPSGGVDCWGLDNLGQAQDRTAPAGETYVEVDAGSTSTCAITSAGRVECWGNDSEGESNPPAGTFSSVSVGRGYACGIRTTGELACWGDAPVAPHAYGVVFAPPVDAPPTVNVARAGRVIPVKAEVFDGATEVRTGHVTIDVVAATDCGAGTADQVESYALTAGTSHGELRWDATADRWVTGLDTSGLGTGCLHARIAVDGEPAGHFVLQPRR